MLVIEWRCQKNWVFNSGKCYLFSAEGSNSDFIRSKTTCMRNNATLVIFKGRPELVIRNDGFFLCFPVSK